MITAQLLFIGTTELLLIGGIALLLFGGKKLPEAEALTMAYRAIQSGARGVDMGRNIFQSECPIAMCKAVAKVVHEGFSDKEAYEFFLSEKN